MNAPTDQGYLSPRTVLLPPSPIRALLDVQYDGEMLDLTGGIPDPQLFPSDALAEAAARVIRERSALVLQYAPTEGLEELRAFIAERLAARGFSVEPSDVLVTHGSQHALCAITQVLGAKGRKALLEEPVYPGALQAFTFSECVLAPLPVTPTGWKLSVFEQERPELVYVIPHFQNPTGRCATPQQVEQLATLARRRGFFVIEDDAYGELDFEGRAHRPLVAGCHERGILIGSFSKTLCPGLRLGYVVAPKALKAALVKTLQTTTLQPGTLTQYVAWELLSTFDYEAHLRRLREHYRLHAMALSRLCRTYNWSHREPEGGFFLWVDTKKSAKSFAHALARAGLNTVPEDAFTLLGSGTPPHHLRLAFTRFSNDVFARERFERALRAQD